MVEAAQADRVLARGLSSADVAERVARGQTNAVELTTTRSVAQIVRANVFTRFNALLGGMLAVIIVVGPVQDALFGIVLVANALIGIVQELRAKRTLDRLTLLTAPRARVLRDGAAADLAVTDVVLDDVLILEPGFQVVVDGEVIGAEGLEIDESLLTGEADPVEKTTGDEVRSGSFVAAGTGRFHATAVGPDAYAVRLAQEARRFAVTRSELIDGINRILTWVTWAIIPTATLLFISQLRNSTDPRTAVAGAVAGTVAMVPEGLVLLTSLAFAVAAVRLARRRVLVKELPAVEGLARVDTLCIDKTGTLTEGRLEVESVEPVDGASRPEAEELLAALAASDPAPNSTMRAIAERFDRAPAGWDAADSVPFSSARKWSAVAFAGRGALVLGAPDVLLTRVDGDPGVARRAEELAGEGHRVVLAARSPAAAVSADGLPEGLRPVALVILGDRIRPSAELTLRYFAEQRVRVKVISGDDPRTVGAIAGRLGLE